MTLTDAQNAIDARAKVQGGAPGTEDYDTGYIIEIQWTVMALVAWDSGVRTPTPLEDLTSVA